MTSSDANIIDATQQKPKVGRPRCQVSGEQVQRLRDRGASWRTIARTLSTSTATVMRLHNAVSRAGRVSQNSGPSVAEPNRVTSPIAPVACFRIQRLALTLCAGNSDRVWPVNGRSPGPCSRCGCNVWRRRPDGSLDCSACKPLN